MKSIIISIKPKFCKAIYSGAKVVELRRNVGQGFVPGARLYIYSSSPVKAITGEALIDRVEVLSVENIKRKYLDVACIGSEAFDEYYLGKSSGYVIFLRNVFEYNAPLSLEYLAGFGFRPPQSYMYVRGEFEGIIKGDKCT